MNDISSTASEYSELLKRWKIGKVSTKDEAHLFAEVLGEMSCSLAKVDWVEFTMRFNNKVNRAISEDDVAREVYTFKTPELLLLFAKDVIKIMKEVEENIACDFDTKQDALNDALKKSHEEPQAANKRVHASAKQCSKICARCNLPKKDGEWCCCEDEPDENPQESIADEEPEESTDLPFGVNLVQLKAWFDDESIHVCRACLNIKSCPVPPYGFREFVGGHTNSTCPRMSLTKEQQKNVLNLKRRLENTPIDQVFKKMKKNPVNPLKNHNDKASVNQKKDRRLALPFHNSGPTKKSDSKSSSVDKTLGVKSVKAKLKQPQSSEKSTVKTNHAKTKTPQKIMPAETGERSVKFPEYLKKQYKQMINVQGDGHCGFRAIALCLNKMYGVNQHSYRTVREAAAYQYLAHSKLYHDEYDRLNASIPEAVPDDMLIGIEDQLMRFNSPEETEWFWFEPMTHGVFLADWNGAPICVTSDNISDFVGSKVTGYTISPVTRLDPTRKPIFLHFKDFHYHATIPTDTCVLPPMAFPFDNDVVRRVKEHYKGILIEDEDQKLVSTVVKKSPSKQPVIEYESGARKQAFPWIHYLFKEMYDVAPDGHCGYRAVALALNLSRNTTEFNWSMLRTNLFKYLTDNRQLFEAHDRYFEGSVKGKDFVEVVLKQINHFNVPADSSEYWFEPFRHGQLLADMLTVPICVYGHATLNTWLPIQQFDASAKPIYIIFQGSHYRAGIAETEDTPMPPPGWTWKIEVHKKYIEYYTERFQRFKQLHDIENKARRKGKSPLRFQDDLTND